jgi:hypothetical protein
MVRAGARIQNSEFRIWIKETFFCLLTPDSWILSEGDNQ